MLANALYMLLIFFLFLFLEKWKQMKIMLIKERKQISSDFIFQSWTLFAQFEFLYEFLRIPFRTFYELLWRARELLVGVSFLIVKFFCLLSCADNKMKVTKKRK